MVKPTTMHMLKLILLMTMAMTKMIVTHLASFVQLASDFPISGLNYELSDHLGYVEEAKKITVTDTQFLPIPPIHFPLQCLFCAIHATLYLRTTI